MTFNLEDIFTDDDDAVYLSQSQLAKVSAPNLLSHPAKKEYTYEYYTFIQYTYKSVCVGKKFIRFVAHREQNGYI